MPSQPLRCVARRETVKASSVSLRARNTSRPPGHLSRAKILSKGKVPMSPMHAAVYPFLLPWLSSGVRWHWGQFWGGGVTAGRRQDAFRRMSPCPSSFQVYGGKKRAFGESRGGIWVVKLRRHGGVGVHPIVGENTRFYWKMSEDGVGRSQLTPDVCWQALKFPRCPGGHQKTPRDGPNLVRAFVPPGQSRF